MSERMKPPARRTGRTLGGGTKKATPPPLPRPPNSPPSSTPPNRPLPRAKAAPPRARRRFNPHLSLFPPRHRHRPGPRPCPKWPSPSQPPTCQAAPCRNRPPGSRLTRPSTCPRRGRSPLGCRWSGTCRLWSQLPSLQHLRSRPRSQPTLLRNMVRLPSPPGLVRLRPPRWPFARPFPRSQAAPRSP